MGFAKNSSADFSNFFFSLFCSAELVPGEKRKDVADADELLSSSIQFRFDTCEWNSLRIHSPDSSVYYTSKGFSSDGHNMMGEILGCGK